MRSEQEIRESIDRLRLAEPCAKAYPNCVSAEKMRAMRIALVWVTGEDAAELELACAIGLDVMQ